jgi:hypothetical protein
MNSSFSNNTKTGNSELISQTSNGGFPPLILKNNKKSENNKERLIKSNINNNITIRQILQTKNTTNILDKLNNENTELDIVTSL